MTGTKTHGKSNSSECSESYNLEWEGKTWSLTDLAEHAGISRSTLRKRLNKQGMSLEEAIKTPLKT
jgi:lambda repressor-like predicted transcriptional regulator